MVEPDAPLSIRPHARKVPVSSAAAIDELPEAFASLNEAANPPRSVTFSLTTCGPRAAVLARKIVFRLPPETCSASATVRQGAAGVPQDAALLKGEVFAFEVSTNTVFASTPS